MEGKFIRKRMISINGIVTMIGLLFIVLYVFRIITFPESAMKFIYFLFLGILFILITIPSWLLNHHAFLHIDEESIKAKYHWSNRIDCKLSDVTYASASINTLTIQLKNGEIHTITGINNSLPLADFIKSKISFNIDKDPEELIEKLNALKSNRKKGLIHVCLGVLFMFIFIFVTAFLTGGRDLHEFSKIDWIVFGCMSLIGIVNFINTFYLADKVGKQMTPIEIQHYLIQRRIIETKPLFPGNYINVFTDVDYSARFTIYKYPNEDSYYFIGECFDSDFTLFKNYESELFNDIEDLQEEFDTIVLIDITDCLINPL